MKEKLFDAGLKELLFFKETPKRPGTQHAKLLALLCKFNERKK